MGRGSRQGNPVCTGTGACKKETTSIHVPCTGRPLCPVRENGFSCRLARIQECTLQTLMHFVVNFVHNSYSMHSKIHKGLVCSRVAYSHGALRRCGNIRQARATMLVGWCTHLIQREKTATCICIRSVSQKCELLLQRRRKCADKVRLTYRVSQVLHASMVGCKSTGSQALSEARRIPRIPGGTANREPPRGTAQNPARSRQRLRVWTNQNHYNSTQYQQKLNQARSSRPIKYIL